MSINANNDALNEILEVINDLPNSKEEQTKSIDITENGTTVVTPDEGMTLGEVTVNVAIESGGGEDDFIGIKYSNFDEKGYYLPRTVDARSLDKVLSDPNETSAAKINAENNLALYCAFYNSAATSGNGYFTEIREAYLPTKAAKLDNTFYCCIKLKRVYGNLENIKVLRAAFDKCHALEEVPYMPNLTEIMQYSFRDCRSLTEITLPSTVTSIATNAFSGCSNLKKIYCKFAEGSVTGAPWGAPNADIEVVYVTEV
jgi:hypothetical protein